MLTGYLTTALAAILNNDDGSLINMLYYNNEKFALLGQESVTNGLRDINIYELSL